MPRFSMLAMPDALEKVPVLVRVLNSIRSAEMRLPDETKTTLPLASMRSTSVNSSAWSANSWMSLQSMCTSCEQDRVRLVDVDRPRPLTACHL